ncbi:hypothetical protein [Natronomonas marina]|uniref:hypothetical protein n=1 Tax=Natronomonas marina TaxID=2961939 RepID=UPI0020C98FCA|nr:hypothetical protein [Natronomonas marina]
MPTVTVELTPEEYAAVEAAASETRWTNDIDGWLRDAARLRLASDNDDEILPVHDEETRVSTDE